MDEHLLLKDKNAVFCCTGSSTGHLVARAFAKVSVRVFYTGREETCLKKVTGYFLASGGICEIAIARAGGHAVATGHITDHSLGAVIYALKAMKYAGKSMDAERIWQNEQLVFEIRELVLEGLTKPARDIQINKAYGIDLYFNNNCLINEPLI